MPADIAAAFAATAWPGRLRRQQAEALAALDQTWAGGGTRAWLALPPGAGKTLVGLEAARRLGRRTIVFGPNTAIQAQWINEWASFQPATVSPGSDRTLVSPVTALTYQSLAVFDPDAEVDEEGHQSLTAAGPGRGTGLLARLHTNGRSLVDAMRDAGPITLVLDEAHHLLEVWGALLAELLTRNGIRSGRWPVDRVLARSEAKTHGAVEIVTWQAAVLGDRLRALVLCDHERASATLPARLVGVLDPQAGSARLMLENLVADQRTVALEPMLVTGRAVAADAATARAFVDFAGDTAQLDPIDDAADGIVEITGRWSSRTWVPLVTRFFEAGRSRVLIGTRGLLGEGWNAPRVNTLIDLTTATTPTSVVQTRGRAIRLDPAWPGKVATNWTVVCVSEDHPGGDSDWQRFVRKHDGYLAVDDGGEIVDGVAHVDDQFSPYKQPPASDFDAVNARMLERAADVDRIRNAWRVGTPYDDRFVHELRITSTRRLTVTADAGLRKPPRLVPAERGLATAESLKGRRRKPEDPRAGAGVEPSGWVFAIAMVATIAAGVAGAFVVGEWLAGVSVPLAFVAGFVAMHLEEKRRRVDEVGRLLARTADQPADLGAIACAVADALKLADESPAGAENVRVGVDASGTYRAVLTGVPADVSQTFVTALDEVLAPLAGPRYLIPRYVLDPVDDPTKAARRWLADDAEPNSVVYHAVPSVLGNNAKRAAAFERAWARWVSSGSVVYTGSPEGTGVLAAQRGQDPFAATTLLRVAWA